jgi:hypothetical protein
MHHLLERSLIEKQPPFAPAQRLNDVRVRAPLNPSPGDAHLFTCAQTLNLGALRHCDAAPFQWKPRDLHAPLND